MYKLFLYQKIN